MGLEHHKKSGDEKHSKLGDSLTKFSETVNKEMTRQEALVRIKNRYYDNNYSKLVFPAEGLGTGMAELDKRSPEIFSRMNYMVYMLFGIDYYGVPDSTN